MKFRVIAIICSFLSLPPLAQSEPFWCPPGRDTVIGHPLSFEALKPQLDAATSEVAQLKMVQTTFRDHLSVLDVSSEAESIAVFERLMQSILDVDGTRFLNTELLRFKPMYRAGVAEASCETLPEVLKDSSPALFAIYTAAETITLVGRTAALDDPSTAKRIASRYSEYDSWLLSDGLPQWPWELWLNGKLIDTDIKKSPPRWQWVLARPSAGMDLSYPRDEEADVVPSLGVELIGFVKYRNSYKKHYGASILATVGTEDGAGYGIALRWNGFWAGYVFRSGDEADAVFLGIDLYKVFNDNAKRKQLVKDIVGDIAHIP